MASSAWLVAPDLGYINGLGMMLSYHHSAYAQGWGAFRMAGAAAVLARCQMRWQTDLGQ